MSTVTLSYANEDEEEEYVPEPLPPMSPSFDQTFRPDSASTIESVESYGESYDLEFGPDIPVIWKTQKQKDKEKEGHEYYKNWLLKMPSGADHLGRMNSFLLFELTRRNLPPDVRDVSGATPGQLRCFLTYSMDFKYDPHTDLIGLRFFKELIKNVEPKPPPKEKPANNGTRGHAANTAVVVRQPVPPTLRNYQAASGPGVVDKTDVSTQTDRPDAIQIVVELMCIDKIYMWIAEACPHLMHSFNELVKLYAEDEEGEGGRFRDVWDPKMRPVTEPLVRTAAGQGQKTPVRDKGCNSDESVLEIEIIIGRAIKADEGLMRYLWARSEPMYERFANNPLLQG